MTSKTPEQITMNIVIDDHFKNVNIKIKLYEINPTIKETLMRNVPESLIRNVPEFKNISNSLLHQAPLGEVFPLSGLGSIDNEVICRGPLARPL